MLEEAKILDKAERMRRVHAIRTWGVTENAEKTALAIIAAMPEGAPMVGIYPSGFGDENDNGDGGISFQRFTNRGGVIVSIDSEGHFSDRWRCDPTYSDKIIRTPAEAADYLT